MTCHVFSLILTVRGVSNKHCLLTFFIGQAPQILMLVANVSSPVVRIHSGSTDLRGFLYLDFTVDPLI